MTGRIDVELWTDAWQASRLWVAVTLLLFVLSWILLAPIYWVPACTVFPPWSAEWVILGCWWGAPDPPPDIGKGS